jgi:hypothetical protein
MAILSNIFWPLCGLFASLRTWQMYNYLLSNAGKMPVSIAEYINKDKNILVNYFKIVPIFDKKANSGVSEKYRRRVNVLTYLFYFSFPLALVITYLRYH